MTGPPAGSPSTKARSGHTARRSHRRCASGRRTARCARTRHGSRSCCAAAERFDPRHRSALIHGLLDAADVLDASHQRTIVYRGLQAGQTSTRLTAPDRLCELDGPETALDRARSDTNATVRAWQPTAEPMQTTLL